MKQIPEKKVIDLVRLGIQIEGSQKAYAKRVGLSESYLSDVLNQRRDISPRILKHLGLERVVYYRRIDGGSL
jgi:DNA-binding transcriptional regulator YdaS (Cro superfamily)